MVVEKKQAASWVSLSSVHGYVDVDREQRDGILKSEK